jgi:hypothetical protein
MSVLKFSSLPLLALLCMTLSACGGGNSLSEEQAIDTFVEARGGGVSADTVTVNGMTECNLSDESKVRNNIDNAWLVNFDFFSPVTEEQSMIALAIGEKDGTYSVVAQAMCP